MTDLILHHYPTSPFSEKVRLIFGLKGLAWRSVHIPPIMPKPDVIALTGGYRKTPFLQVGADIYCDSALISRVAEARQASPTLYPPDVPLAVPLAQWADSTLFWLAVTWTMQPRGMQVLFDNPAPEMLKAFGADRAAFSAGQRRPTLADATVQLKAHLAALDAQVAQAAASGPWLFGAAPTIADFSVAHCLWFIRRGGPVAEILAPHAALTAWLERVLAIGHGTASKLSSADAVSIAREASGHAPVAVEPGLGFEPGQRVTVAALDYGIDPVPGAVVGLTADSVTVERQDERAGTLHVHFPRAGFQIKKEQAA